MKKKAGTKKTKPVKTSNNKNIEEQEYTDKGTLFEDNPDRRNPDFVNDDNPLTCDEPNDTIDETDLNENH